MTTSKSEPRNGRHGTIDCINIVTSYYSYPDEWILYADEIGI